MKKPRPIATYRLQLHMDFTFAQAEEILPYLKQLGVTHIYLSPIFESTKGSTHGYDISDFTKISAERGGEEGFATLDRKCRDLDLGIILDIVPNHMGIAGENPFWQDVLRNGQESEYWNVFDMRLGDDGKIHLPILDASVDELAAKGSIKIESGALAVNGRKLPLAKGSEGGTFEETLEKQHYRLVPWTETSEKISYRRFFDITDLIGVRVEDEEVYRLSHQALLDLLKKYPSICGVRADHIDGLADPGAYLERLREDIPEIWVEKILSGKEELPPSWEINGTTGYEFISYILKALIDPTGFEKIAGYWTQNIDGRWKNFNECVRDSKDYVLETLFPSELKRLVKLSSVHANEKESALFWKGMTEALDVYRVYFGTDTLTEEDRERTREAGRKASRRHGAGFDSAAEKLMPVLLDPKDDTDRQILREWQQLTGPAMAKGLEDTAHYRFTPLTALNEVGCEAKVGDDGRRTFYEWATRRQQTHPESLLATSTHDTKRSEDARHRLCVLADRPERWIEFFETCISLDSDLAEKAKIGKPARYFLYQSIIAAWPFDGKAGDDFIERIKNYMLKSAKESRTETSWLKPDQVYEKSLLEFCENVLGHEKLFAVIREFAEEISAAGAVNALSAVALKLLGGGIPDIYQGCEGWNFSLVDPDNRRPVDFDFNREILKGFEKEDERSALLQSLRANWKNSAIKLWLTQELLAIKTEYGPFDYVRSASIGGPGENLVLGFETDKLVVVCPRYPGSYVKDDLAFSLNITLPADCRKELLSGQNVDRGKFTLGETFPVAVFLKG